MTLSHMEALNTRLAAEQPVVPLRLPVTADEWKVHAHTTIRDASGEVLAECSGHGRHSVEDEAIAAEIVRRVNAFPRLFDALETLTEAITSGAGRDFIEAFVRDASAALEEAKPGWNKVGEPTSAEMRAKGRVRAAAPALLEAAKAGKAYRDALAQCADDPQRMSSFCTAEGDDLDSLFATWESLSDAAIGKAGAA